ncbi:TRAP transporter large permease subunit [Ectothiorhodospiraceae bacterium WFHF3C12]|nr:TRAP transporter large permease subunit [Ectothiorhodospiraceae bacterium WFHF3C12]
MNTILSDRADLVHAPRRGYARLIITVPVATLLLATIAFSMSAYVHSQMLAVGQSIWDSYGLVRHDVQEPACNPDPDIDIRVRQQLRQARERQADSLLAPTPPDPERIRESLIAQREQCRDDHAAFERSRELRESPALQAYAAVEGAVGAVSVAGLDAQQYLLVLIVLTCAWMATTVYGQVAIRSPLTRLDCRVGSALQLIANAALLWSAVSWREVAGAAGAEASALHPVWIAGFAVLTLISVYQLINVPRQAGHGGAPGHALLTVPLYTWMTLVAAGYFFLAEAYPSGLAVQLIKMVKQADLYLHVALYVWAGMLIKQTRLATLLFDIARPWKLAPELITIVVVFVAAVPTALTGASGILLVAVGAVIYDEIRLSGARRPLAFAATAMSGSMGVVLNPCLMVVVVAALNRQVTTSQLYGWGGYVFLLTSAAFAIVTLLTRRSPLTFASPREAIPGSLKALRPLLPYVVIALAVVVFFAVALDQPFNEFSAPIILPLTLLIMLLYDRSAVRRQNGGEPPRREDGFWYRVRESTSESTMHIGALLMLMALSIALGGVVERSGIMAAFPADFGSIWMAMGALVVVLVIVGMFLDPYGAIILVSATVASVAYDNGIHPVHFWMVVLVAFELGYLTPPVALNQLLTRQVVGERELVLAHDEARQRNSFWGRHERLLLPITVMASSLLLVAFMPLLFYGG